MALLFLHRKKKRKRRKSVNNKSPAFHLHGYRGSFYFLLPGGTAGLFNTASIQFARATLLLRGFPV